jgi:hypothetical protein
VCSKTRFRLVIMPGEKRKSQQSRSGEGTHQIDTFFKKRKVEKEESSDFLNDVVKGEAQAQDSNEEAPKVKGVASLQADDELKLASGVVTQVSADTQIASWLRSLTLEEANHLYRVCIAGKSLTSLSQVSESDRAVLARLRAGPASEGRDGAWYTAWSTCKVVATKEKGSSHPRAQVKLDQGANSLGGQLKAGLSNKAWETLTQHTSVLKIGYHILAYNALPERDVAPVPLNLGAGGSISHPCDQRGCVDHLEATPVHKDNMDRQRCSGVLVMHFRDAIIAEVPCGHGKDRGKDGSLEVQLKKSCIKVSLYELTEEILAVMKNL